MKKFLYILIVFTIFVLPSFSFAQLPSNTGTGLNGNGSQGANLNSPDTGVTGGKTVINSTSGKCDLTPKPKLNDLINYVTCMIVRSIVPLIFALAVMMFVWGVVQYVIGAEEEAKREKGRMFMIWGIIALTVMVSVWGLVAILRNTFGIKDTAGNNNFIPQLQTR